MIPLFYILPTDEVYTEASGIIRHITPIFSNFRNAIQIEFEYNLEEFFYLEIVLSEFDQPREISLYGYHNSDTIEVSDEKDQYLIQGKKVALEMSKKVILDIVNNLVTEDSFLLGTEITLRVIKPQQNIEDRPVVTSLLLMDSTLTIGLQGEMIRYRQGGKASDYLPLISYSEVSMTPTYIDGHYNVFDMEGSLTGLSLVIMPPNSFEAHYLFRQEKNLKRCDIAEDGSFVMGGYLSYLFQNGTLEIVNRVVSSQEFLIYNEQEEYKTYIFNAARDKNLYTEVSLLFPAVQHHSMMVYDLLDNVLIKGRTIQDIVADEATDKMMHRLRIVDCRDFFGRNIKREFEFIYHQSMVNDPVWLETKSTYGLGQLYVTDLNSGDRDIVPVDSRPVDIQKKGYISASNNRYSFSIKKDRLLQFSQKRDFTVGRFKRITPTDYIAPRYNFRYLDFNEGKLGVSKGTDIESVDLAYPTLAMISKGATSITDNVVYFAGMTFAYPVEKITTDAINITNFSDYLLLCRMTEPVEYGVRGVRSGTRNLLKSVTFVFALGEVTAIYNIDLDKVYYINFSTKDSTADTQDLPLSISNYLQEVNEVELKLFLRDGSMGTYNPSLSANSTYITTSSDKMYSEEVTREACLEDDGNIVFKSSGGFGIVNSKSLIGSELGTGVYVPRRSSHYIMSASFGTDTSIYRKVFSGIYSNTALSVLSASIANGLFTLSYQVGGVSKTITIRDDGGPIEYRHELKSDIVDNIEIFSTMIPFTISGSFLPDKIFQQSHLLCLESDFGESFSIDVPVLRLMISEGTLGIDRSIYSVFDGQSIILRPSLTATSLAITGGVLVCGGQTVDSLAPTGSAAMIVGESTEMINVVPAQEYDSLLTGWTNYDGSNENIRISEWKTEEGYAILLPIDSAAHIQIKEP